MGLSLFFTSTAWADNKVWLIGGGPNPEASQVSIELNTIWVRDYVQQRHPDWPLKLFFTSGTDKTLDVREWKPAEDNKTILQPLARVFGDQHENGDVYRRNNVGSIDGTTRAVDLLATMDAEFSQMKAGDQLWLLYQGHGGVTSEDYRNNTLRVWGDSKVTVSDLDEALSKLDPAVTVRFVFPQCFSGGFARLMRPAVGSFNKDAAPRCGFLAQVPDREAEGCTSSIEVGDYRDYTTYFFAALDGKTRLGEPLAENPDLDGDGKVSLHEAHLYTLGTAVSADLSRSTSEVYLEQWQPWYLRWIGGDALEDNEFGKLAQKIARRSGLPASGPGLAAELTKRRKQLAAQIADLEREKENNDEIVKGHQAAIQKDLLLHWPELATPYTNAYRALLSGGADEAMDFIVSHTRYEKLVMAQDRDVELDGELLKQERELVQLEKIARLRKLARLQAQFDRFASDEEKAAYAALVGCEGAVF